MIYLRLHQARSEEIEPGASREIPLQERENFATAAKIRYSSEISQCSEFRYCSEISLCSEIPPVAKFPVPCFCVQTTPFLVNFISTLTVIILVRLDWYFHLFLRLYKPFSEHFVT